MQRSGCCRRVWLGAGEAGRGGGQGRESLRGGGQQGGLEREKEEREMGLEHLFCPGLGAGLEASMQ